MPLESENIIIKGYREISLKLIKMFLQINLSVDQIILYTGLLHQIIILGIFYEAPLSINIGDK